MPEEIIIGKTQVRMCAPCGQELNVYTVVEKQEDGKYKIRMNEKPDTIIHNVPILCLKKEKE